jgi:hypothetical protein
LPLGAGEGPFGSQPIRPSTASEARSGDTRDGWTRGGRTWGPRLSTTAPGNQSRDEIAACVVHRLLQEAPGVRAG